MSNASSSVGYLQSLRARDIMSKDVFWADAEDSVQTTLATMDRCGADYVLLRRADKLDGIVSRSDLLGAVSLYLRPQFCQYRRLSDDASLQIKIKWVASRPVYTTQPDTTVMVVMEKMCRFGGKCLPVVDETDKVHGLMLISEILAAICPADAVSHARIGVSADTGNPQATGEQHEPDGAQETRSGRHVSEDEVPKESQMKQATMTPQSQKFHAEIQGSLNNLEQRLEDHRVEQEKMKQTLEQQSAESTQLRETLEQQTKQGEQLQSQLTAKTAEWQAAQDLLETQTRESQEATEQFHSERDHLTQGLEQQSEELAKARETLEQESGACEQLRSELDQQQQDGQTQLDAMKKAHQVELDSVNQTLTEKGEALAQLQDALQQQAEAYDQVHSQLSDRGSALETAQKELEMQRVRNGQAQKELQEGRNIAEELIVQLQDQFVNMADSFAEEEMDGERLDAAGLDEVR
ncbi:MAG: CBS domain-containing protein [Planctomycetes bacterium]|nr:CBS domain-containing protein [Planctomycetota bacterium]